MAFYYAAKEGEMMADVKGIEVKVNLTDVDVFKDMIQVVKRVINDPDIPLIVRQKYGTEIRYILDKHKNSKIDDGDISGT